jgi:hypothetical protein
MCGKKIVEKEDIIFRAYLSYSDQQLQCSIFFPHIKSSFQSNILKHSQFLNFCFIFLQFAINNKIKYALKIMSSFSIAHLTQKVGNLCHHPSSGLKLFKNSSSLGQFQSELGERYKRTSGL